MAEQAADHRLLAVGDGPQHEGEFDVGSQLDQAEFADLRERPIATRPGRGPAEGGGVGVRVGDVIDRPIEPHEAEPAVEGPGRLGLGQGMNELLKQAADRGDAQTLSGHAQAGPMRGLLAEAKPACVLEDLADRQLGQDSHGQHHPADDFVGQHTTALIGSAGVRKHLANGLGRDNLFQSRQSIQEPARRIGRQRALSWLHRSHSLLGTLLVPKPKITRGRDLRLADGHSYGFRLERCCADALDQCHKILSGPHGPNWILEGDIKACFDRISHNWLLDHIPMDKELLRKWLKAGFLEKHVLFATTEGTPQGGIISPALANRALDGLQQLLEQRFGNTRRRRKEAKVHLVRYADDFIITGTSRVLLQREVQPLVEHFLRERGLELSHEKTRITHIKNGFDFLGQTVRRFRCGKVLIKPSKRSVKTFLAKIQETIDNSGDMTAGDLIRRLNQQIKGWTMYHRYAVSKRIFAAVDNRIFWKLKRWCHRRHRQKSWKWIKKKYFQQVGHRNWVFTGDDP